jgi:quercetin dioxygenase-like cupin family protein
MRQVFTNSFWSILLIVFSIYSCKNKSLPDPYEAGWKGEKVCEVIEENSEYRILKCTFPPNVGHELHYHNPHFGYTLQGSTFRIKDDKGTNEYEVPTGFSFSNDEVIEHEVLNIGDSTAVFLIMESKK